MNYFKKFYYKHTANSAEQALLKLQQVQTLRVKFFEEINNYYRRYQDKLQSLGVTPETVSNDVRFLVIKDLDQNRLRDVAYKLLKCWDKHSWFLNEDFRDERHMLFDIDGYSLIAKTSSGSVIIKQIDKLREFAKIKLAPSNQHLKLCRKEFLDYFLIK